MKAGCIIKFESELIFGENMDHKKYFHDVGYYEYKKDFWMMGKYNPDCEAKWGRTTPRAIEAASKVHLRDTDIFIGTYPKSGQTWLMTILHQIQNINALKESNESITPDISSEAPFLEIEFDSGETGSDLLNKLEIAPRVIKTHLSYDIMKENVDAHPDMKVMQIMRNPKDTLVSWYHHNRSDSMMGWFKGTWDDFFQLFKEKRLGWGDVMDVNLSWYKFNKERKNSLVLRYEEMKKDPKLYISKIAKFIGQDLTEADIELIVERSSFKKMSQLFKKVIKETDPGWKSEKSDFIRKGVVGDWKNYFTEEQSAYVEQRCREEYEPLGLLFDF